MSVNNVALASIMPFATPPAPDPLISEILRMQDERALFWLRGGAASGQQAQALLALSAQNQSPFNAISVQNRMMEIAQDFESDFNYYLTEIAPLRLGTAVLFWPPRAYPRIDLETAQRSRERARGLLKSLLTPEQWAEFEAAGAVTERIAGCEYKLTPGGMIEARNLRIVGAPVIERWCVAPDPHADGNTFMPDEDKLIGQLLHLRAGPDRVREMANVFPGR